MLLLCILIRCTWYHTWWANSKLQCTSKYEHLASNARREWRPAGLELMDQKSLDPKYSYIEGIENMWKNFIFLALSSYKIINSVAT